MHKATALLAVLVLSPDRLHAQDVHPSPNAADSAVLASLREHGADLSKPTEHLFYLYFPDERTARAAASDIASGQAAHNVSFDNAELDRPHERRTQWMVRLTATMRPDLAVVGGLGAWFTAVARKHGGEYDGWEAAVTK